MYGESTSKTNSSHSSREKVWTLLYSNCSELRNRLREDTQVLIRTIRSSIDLLQQARSASATPAFGYVISTFIENSPQSIDVPAEMEEVSKQLQPFSLPPAAVSPGPGSEARMSSSPMLSGHYAQDKVLEVPSLNWIDCRERRR